MPIVQFTRFKTDKTEEMVQIVRQAKKIFEKHGAEFLRPVSTLARGQESCWLRRAIPVGKFTAKCRRPSQRTQSSRRCRLTE